MPKIHPQIDTLLDEFDFERVHTAMVAVGWKWSDRNRRLYQPSVKQLRICAGKLLRDIAKRGKLKVLASGTGGFTASWEPNQEGDGSHLKLVFTLESAEEVN